MERMCRVRALKIFDLERTQTSSRPMTVFTDEEVRDSKKQNN